MLPPRSGIRDGRFDEFTRILEIPDGVLQDPWFGLLDQIELPLWIKDIDLDREGPAQDIKQCAQNLLTQLGRAVA